MVLIINRYDGNLVNIRQRFDDDGGDDTTNLFIVCYLTRL